MLSTKYTFFASIHVVKFGEEKYNWDEAGVMRIAIAKTKTMSSLNMTAMA